MTIIYLISLTLFLVASIKLSRINIYNTFQNVLSPRLVLVISYYMYSAAMPISRLFFASKKMNYDIEYMGVHMLGALGILIGLYFQKYFLKFKAINSSKQILQTYLPMTAVIIISLTMAIIMFREFKILGWNLGAIFSPRDYQFCAQAENQRQSLFNSILWLFPISSILLAFIGAYATKNRKLILLSLIYAGVFIIFFLLRGSRSYAGAMALPIICVYFYLKPVNIKKVLFICFCLYIFLYVVGMVRARGLTHIADVSFAIEKFDPLNQEFGVNYTAFTKWQEVWKDKPLLLGKSYTIDLVCHMVPRYFWSNRPNMMAMQFSMDCQYIENANELPYVIGFSPIVEAVINFGIMGIVPVFAFFSFIVALLEFLFMGRKAWGIACYAFMIPVLIYWNRSDMALTVKTFIVYLVVSKIFTMLMYKRKVLITNQG